MLTFCPPQPPELRCLLIITVIYHPVFDRQSSFFTAFFQVHPGKISVRSNISAFLMQRRHARIEIPCSLCSFSMVAVTSLSRSSRSQARHTCSMNVCIIIYIYNISMSLHIQACVYVYIYIYIFVNQCVYIYEYVHIIVYIYGCRVCICIYIYMRKLCVSNGNGPLAHKVLVGEWTCLTRLPGFETNVGEEYKIV